MEEIWKDAKGYEGLYQVSNLGRAKSLPKYVIREKNGKWLQPEKILKPSVTLNKYAHITFYKNQKPKRMLLHRVIAINFL